MEVSIFTSPIWIKSGQMPFEANGQWPFAKMWLFLALNRLTISTHLAQNAVCCYLRHCEWHWERVHSWQNLWKSLKTNKCSHERSIKACFGNHQEHRCGRTEETVPRGLAKSERTWRSPKSRYRACRSRWGGKVSVWFFTRYFSHVYNLFAEISIHIFPNTLAAHLGIMVHKVPLWSIKGLQKKKWNLSRPSTSTL